MKKVMKKMKMKLISILILRLLNLVVILYISGKIMKKDFQFYVNYLKNFLESLLISVLSERLFSDVGNIITNKHSSLKSEKVEKLIFLKRNAYLLDIL